MVSASLLIMNMFYNICMYVLKTLLFFCDTNNRHTFLLSYYYGKLHEVFSKFYRRHKVGLKKNATKRESVVISFIIPK